MTQPLTATGGAIVAGIRASFPFAKLSVTPELLRLRVALLGSYEFTPEQVVSLETHQQWGISSGGVEIRHVMVDYPVKIVFAGFGGTQQTLEAIRGAGFIPRASESAMPLRRGMAMRWQVLVLLFVVWNSLCILDFIRTVKDHKPLLPGVGTLLALAMVCAATQAGLRVPWFQRLILKPGRRTGEVRPWLGFVGFLSGVMLVVFGCLTQFRALKIP